jgi:hypothetical protein
MVLQLYNPMYERTYPPRFRNMRKQNQQQCCWRPIHGIQNQQIDSAGCYCHVLKPGCTSSSCSPYSEVPGSWNRPRCAAIGHSAVHNLVIKLIRTTRGKLCRGWCMLATFVRSLRRYGHPRLDSSAQKECTPPKQCHHTRPGLQSPCTIRTRTLEPNPRRLCSIIVPER